MNTKEYPRQFYQLLMRIGFFASDCASFSVASNIFSALHKVRPQHESPLIGLAYNAILEGKFEQAVTILKEQALKVNPNSEAAKTYLGLALGCKGDKEASNLILQDVVQNGKEASNINFAKLIPEALASVK